MPVTRMPRRTAEIVTARITAFRPGASPPPVLIKRCISSAVSAAPRAWARGPTLPADLVEENVTAERPGHANLNDERADGRHGRERDGVLDGGPHSGSQRDRRRVPPAPVGLRSNH